MVFSVLWSGLISFIHRFGEIADGLIAAATCACCMLMSDLTHRWFVCKAHLNMQIGNVLDKFITIDSCSTIGERTTENQSPGQVFNLESQQN